MKETANATPSKPLSIAEFDKRISVLERKAAREKKARNLAESQLEEYSRKIYETNQSLQIALHSATQKQSELKYLGMASSCVASERPLEDMIANIVELTGKFCRAYCGKYLVTDQNNQLKGDIPQVWQSKSGWHLNQELEDLITANLPLSLGELKRSWTISSVKSTNKGIDDTHYTLFYINFALADQHLGWLAFLTQADIVSDEILSVLATAKEHLLSGIRRRLTDERILRRNTQLQESLDKLEKARRQLIQSEKMASLGQLAAGVAHEINNPLAFIRSNMEVLKQYLTDYQTFHKNLEVQLQADGKLDSCFYQEQSTNIDLPYISEDSGDLMISNISGLDRVKEIVENLKSFSHAGDEALIPISIFDCVAAALKVTNSLFKYEHHIENSLSQTCPAITGNAGQLQQVFINLFVNAAYAMEGGGKLSISSTQIGNKLVIKISDTGCGMDEETLTQLFTPFFTTKPVGVGTGLGLSVSYAILEAHHVGVEVNSELGKGSTFNLSFPIPD